MRRASATGHQADATGSAPAPTAALLAAILETAEDGIVGLAPDRTIAFANQAAARYFGRPAADMVGERAEALFPADQRPTVDEAVDPGTDRVTIAGVAVGRGDTVVLRPGRRADAPDLFLTATVAGVFRDVDGHDHVAVTVDDDPATEVQSWQGRYLYFHPDEVEPAGGPGAVP